MRSYKAWPALPPGKAGYTRKTVASYAFALAYLMRLFIGYQFPEIYFMIVFQLVELVYESSIACRSVG
ncbi:hypothetical protein A4R26_30000 [Niastella populi]|uniref:Uncharacterized protein n=1 Tax=Niastella populi TaxID=550983 RepID=A0A1V9EVW6_9BACT|nr:hypothetical protein A4R26_30000 [Niastella populi]